MFIHPINELLGRVFYATPYAHIFLFIFYTLKKSFMSTTFVLEGRRSRKKLARSKTRIILKGLLEIRQVREHVKESSVLT